MKKKNIDILQEIITAVLEIEDITDFSDLTQSGLPKWDSLAIVNLVVAVESDLGVKINDDEFANFISYQKIVSILDKKGL